MSANCPIDSDRSKDAFTFEFSIKDFSSITEGQRCTSPRYTVNNLSWEVHIQRSKDDSNKLEKSNDKLAIYLEAIPPSANSQLWSCFASVQLILLTQESSLSRFRNSSADFERLFTSTSKAWGSPRFISWNSVTDPANGFIKNDLVKFRVHIVADMPRNIISDHYVVPPISVDNWFHLFENKLNDRIVHRISDEFKKLDATIEKVQNSMETFIQNFKTDFKKTIDPPIDSVRKEIISLEKKFEKTYSDLNPTVDSVRKEIISLAKKYEKTYANK